MTAISLNMMRRFVAVGDVVPKLHEHAPPIITAPVVFTVVAPAT